MGLVKKIMEDEKRHCQGGRVGNDIKVQRQGKKSVYQENE